MPFFNQLLGIMSMCSLILVVQCQTRRVDQGFLNTAAQAGRTVEMKTRIQKQDANDYVGITWYPPDDNFVTGIILWLEHLDPNTPIASRAGNPLNARDYFIVNMNENINGQSMLNEYILSVTVPDSLQAARILGSKIEANILLHSDIKTSANLVIVGEPECPSDATAKTEGDTLYMHCNVSFHGYRAPQVEWRDYNDMPFTGDAAGELIIDSDAAANTNVASRQSTRQLSGEDDMKNFHCVMTFVPGANGTVDAANGAPPVYEDRCMSMYNVEYYVRDTAIYKVGSMERYDPAENPELILTEGEELYCNASGSGSVTYQWNCQDFPDFPDQFMFKTTEQTLVIEGNLIQGDQVVQCQCISINTINGQSRTDTLFVSFFAYMSGGGEGVSTSGSDMSGGGEGVSTSGSDMTRGGEGVCSSGSVLAPSLTPSQAASTALYLCVFHLYLFLFQI